MPAVVDQERILAEIVERLVSALAPRRIILFGSRASETARPDSDFDLLIVWRDENPPFGAPLFERLFWGSPFRSTSLW
jgi:predicted nucleotidyltransferase